MMPRPASLLLPLAFLALLGAGLSLRPPRQDAPYEPRPVAGNVQWIEGTMGGNVAVSVGADGALVVDSYVSGAKDAWEAAVGRAAGASAVRMILNTHWHGDHTGNNASFGKSATIIAHQNVRRRLLGDPQLAGRGAQGTAPSALPTLTYEDGVELHFNGETVRVHHFAAAHTDGDSVALFEGSRVAHLGDLFFNGRFPFIDLESGGSVDGFVAAVEAALELVPEDWTIIPGHGPLARRVDLVGYLAMLRETRGLVAEALEAGKSTAEMKAAGLLDEWADWAWGFISLERYLETLVRGLAGR